MGGSDPSTLYFTLAYLSGIIARPKVVWEAGMYQGTKALNSWRKRGESTIEIGWRSSQTSYLAVFVDCKTKELPNFTFRGAEWLELLRSVDGPTTVDSPCIRSFSTRRSGLALTDRTCTCMIDLWGHGGAKSCDLSIGLNVPIADGFWYRYIALSILLHKTTINTW